MGVFPVVDYRFISEGALSGVWWFIPGTGVYSRNLVYGWFPVVDYRFISDNWVLYPVFGGLLPELGLLVVSSG